MNRSAAWSIFAWISACQSTSPVPVQGAVESTDPPLACFEPELLWQVRGPHHEHEFGVSIVAVGDIDQDGVRDLVTRCHNAFGVSSIFALSGKTGTTLWELSCPGHSSRSTCWFGSSLCGLDDVDGDGVDDFAVADPGGLPFDAREAPYGVWIVSAASGAVLSGHTEGNHEAEGYGTSMVSPGDIDGDGVRDLLVRSWTSRVEEVVDAISARSGERIWRSTVDRLRGSRKPRLELVEDCNDDGLRDFVDWRSPPAEHRRGLCVYSSADGSLIRVAPIPYAEAEPEWIRRAFGDVNGDGIEDWLVQRHWNSPGAEVISGDLGHALTELRGPLFDAHFLGDLDGDGEVEVAPVLWNLDALTVYSFRRQ